MIIKLHSKHLVFLISAMSLQGISSADTLYWDGTDTSQDANGGAGTWNVSDANWDSFLRGGTNAVWNNLAPDFAVFGGSSGTVALGGMINVSGVQFNTTGYTITASASNTLSFGGHSNVIFNNIAAATITGTVGGSGNLIFSAANPAAAGTLTLNGTSTGGWSGTTTINPSMTLSLSNDNQALNNTSGITLNGGGIILTNASATAATNNKINDSATITSNGGTLSIINTSGSGVYTETIGSVALTTGQLNIGLNNNHSSAGSQTLTLSGLTRTGASNTSAVTFSAFTTGPNTTKNMIAVTGAADGFLGAWATTGTGVGGAAQTDYAFITDVGGIKYVTAANIGATAENSTSWTAGGNNVTLSGAATLSGTRTLNTLRYTGNAQILALGANNLETYGILNGGSGLLTVSSASTGVLTTPTGGGHLHLNAGNNAITVSTPINDNGGAVTLVKNGAGILTLSSTTSNFSGGVVLNAGSLVLGSIAGAANSFLGSGGGITVNGAVNINAQDTYNMARTLIINEGGNLTLGNGFGVTGVFSGNGALTVTSSDDFNFTNAANTFTGTITSSTAGATNYGLTFASIGDTAGSGLINLLDQGTFRWTSASGSTTTLTNRQFALAATGTTGGLISALGTTAASNLVINKDLLITGTAGVRRLRLGGTNLGDNTYAGNIADGTEGGTSVVSLSKEEAGRWILSGNNSYSGGTTLSLGTLVIGNANALPAAGTLVVAGGTLESTIGTLTSGRFIATGGIISASLGGSQGFNKFGTGTTNLNGTANDFTGGITVGGGTLAPGASSKLGQNVAGNSILIRDAGILSLTSEAQSGSNQTITLSSSFKSAGPVSTTGGGANAGGRLAVLSLGFNGLPSGAISQANTNGGVIVINGVTGYNTDLSTVLTGKNLFLGAIGTSTFTGAAGTVAAGNGSLYRLGGGGGQITFNTTNLFTGENGVQVGSTFVNGGGTVVISAAQDYTGVTTVSQGTLTFSGANGSATGSTGVTLNGGKLTLDNTTNNSDRIGNTAAITLSNGGELQFRGNASGTIETIGDLNIGQGYSIVTSQGVTATSTLAASAFNRANNGTALFRGTSLGTASTGAIGRITLSDTAGLTFVGATTLNNAANTNTTKDVRIIPYLTGATAEATAGDTFVTYDTALGFRVLNTTNQFNTTVTANTNVRLASAQTNIATTSINSLIIANNTSSTIADGATLTVASGAILFSNTGTIAPVTAATSTLAFGAQEGIITTVANGVISARITGSAGLTKSGLGQLTLSSANNSFSGGIVVNGGTLSAAVDANLGAASNTITFNGNAAFGTGSVTYARDLILNNGAIVTLSSGNTNPIISGNITGTGGISITGGFGQQIQFTGPANTFEGPILFGGTGTGNNAYRMTFASLADSADANGRIVFTNSTTHANGSVFEYTGSSNLNLANRQIEFASASGDPTNGHQIRSNGVGTLSVATDLIVSTPIAQTLSLRGANTGANTFSGKIGNGDGRVSLIKADAGRWILSGANTFTGTTVVSGGTLELANSLALQNSVLDTTSSLAGSASAGLRTTQTSLTFGGLNGNKNFAATGGLFTTTSGGYDSVTALTLNPGAGVSAFYSGVIENGAAGMSLSKTGTGTQVLSGIHTYTGATNVNAGTLELNGSTHASSTVAIGTAGTLTGAGTVNGNATLTGNGIINKSSGTIVGTLGVNGGFWNGNGTVGGLVTSSSGTFTISNSATLTATSGVSVTGGTVVVNGTLTGGLTAAADTTVYGSGTVTGTTTISGNHNPGNSPGIQTFENLSYTGGSAAVQWELNANSVLNSPVVFDQIIVEGDLDFAGLTSLNLLFNGSGSTVNWDDEFWASNQSWTIYDVAGTTSNFNKLKLTTSNWLDGSGLAYGSSLNAGGSFVLGLGVNGNDVVLNYTVIPEPKAALIGGLGILLLFRRRR